MDIEQGGEWFHNKTLAVVEVGKCSLGRVYFDGPEGTDMAGITPLTHFLREYTRNEPVTAEMIDRLWPSRPSAFHYLAPINTLRDLLNAMKVFGVDIDGLYLATRAARFDLLERPLFFGM